MKREPLKLDEYIKVKTYKGYDIISKNNIVFMFDKFPDASDAVLKEMYIVGDEIGSFVYTNVKACEESINFCVMFDRNGIK